MAKMKGYAAMSPAFPRKGGKNKTKVMKKVPPQTEGYAGKGKKAREKRLEKVPM